VRPSVAHDQARPRIGERGVFSASKKRDACTTSGEISTTSARSMGWLSAAPTVTPAPQADDGDVAGMRVQEQRQVRDELLRQHVAAVGRIGPCRRPRAWSSL
jgi:hypothetical protein